MRIGLLRFSIQAVLVVSAVSVIGLALMWHWSSQPKQAFMTMFAAGFICLIMAIVSLIPITLVIKRNRDWLPQVLLVATGSRILLTTTGAMLVYGLVIESQQKFAFALWTLGYYLVLLVWETITALRIMKRLYPNLTPAATTVDK